MDPCNELFQGELTSELAGIFTAGYEEGDPLPEEEKEDTGNTCGRTCSCLLSCEDQGPEADPAPDVSAQNTACKTCGVDDPLCGSTKEASENFSPRVPGWSTPPSPHASL